MSTVPWSCGSPATPAATTSTTARCFPRYTHGLSVGRTAEILSLLGLLHDDRPSQFDTWLARRLTGVTLGIRVDVEQWLRTLHHGGPRSRPRRLETVWGYLNEIQPVLLDWSTRFDHLREVTRDDVIAVGGTVDLSVFPA
ncbi:hypothetical protein [Couchioplanes caeruleus]|uniref:Uncharacterized protein n=1 Tax=Couchioplanes caeruleus subsp. caeruleus TaxID=56427 RepID=A0A1K0FI75_9ACTN|nr:hypothetical protein [Couchioplanes caeruleus]OJF12533.1 hypothetical protein BG844_20190 [Couchioplanes caeruleus subsp. caeruleus]